MTKSEAREILRHVWGYGESLTHAEAVKITAAELPGETALDTTARVAGVDVAGVESFDHAAIRQRIARAEIAR